MAHKIGDVTDAFFSALGVDCSRVISHNPKSKYFIRHALVPSVRNNQALLDGQSLALFDELRERFCPSGPNGERVYVTRMRHNAVSDAGRVLVLVNEDELIAALTALDFRIVSPENHSIEDQIAIFGSASMIVGPSGSGMFNAAFCARQARN